MLEKVIEVFVALAVISIIISLFSCSIPISYTSGNTPCTVDKYALGHIETVVSHNCPSK